MNQLYGGSAAASFVSLLLPCSTTHVDFDSPLRFDSWAYFTFCHLHKFSSKLAVSLILTLELWGSFHGSMISLISRPWFQGNEFKPLGKFWNEKRVLPYLPVLLNITAAV